MRRPTNPRRLNRGAESANDNTVDRPLMNKDHKSILQPSEKLSNESKSLVETEKIITAAEVVEQARDAIIKSRKRRRRRIVIIK
jgi:hypothetical protein